jgi:2-hydroxychromene-2-carboxylate isomerase
MQNPHVRFYFAYNSPYAFLAHTRIERMLAPFGATIEYKPVYQARTTPVPDDYMQSPKFRYVFEDVVRFADAYGLRLRPGPFTDTRRACLGFLHANARGRGKPYHDRVFAARFLEEADIGSDETLARIAEQAGLDRRQFLAALDDPATEEALAWSNRDAEADGAFGFPFFVWNGKHFWGNDRIEWLVRAIGQAQNA